MKTLRYITGAIAVGALAVAVLPFVLLPALTLPEYRAFLLAVWRAQGPGAWDHSSS